MMDSNFAKFIVQNTCKGSRQSIQVFKECEYLFACWAHLNTLIWDGISTKNLGIWGTHVARCFSLVKRWGFYLLGNGLLYGSFSPFSRRLFLPKFLTLLGCLWYYNLIRWRRLTYSHTATEPNLLLVAAIDFIPAFVLTKRLMLLDHMWNNLLPYTGCLYELCPRRLVQYVNAIWTRIRSVWIYSC